MSRRGFTFIEMLVTILLVAIAVVGVMGGIRALAAADARARKADRLQNLALQKMNELGVAVDTSAADDGGNLEAQGYPDVFWTLTVQPSGATNVDQVTVTVSQGDDSRSLTGLVFIRPAIGSGGQ